MHYSIVYADSHGKRNDVASSMGTTEVLKTGIKTGFWDGYCNVDIAGEKYWFTDTYIPKSHPCKEFTCKVRKV